MFRLLELVRKPLKLESKHLSVTEGEGDDDFSLIVEKRLSEDECLLKVIALICLHNFCVRLGCFLNLRT